MLSQTLKGYLNAKKIISESWFFSNVHHHPPNLFKISAYGPVDGKISDTFDLLILCNFSKLSFCPVCCSSNLKIRNSKFKWTAIWEGKGRKFYNFEKSN